jgi:ssDNA-binding Zn-finger/Zn-ribbon topoisomerase 1
MTNNKTIKQKTRKAKKKSGKFPCEICGSNMILETHHIDGRDIPNYNHWSNLADICPNCHTEIHWGKIVIEKWVMTSVGKKLLWHKKGDESFTGEDSIPHQIEK